MSINFTNIQRNTFGKLKATREWQAQCPGQWFPLMAKTESGFSRRPQQSPTAMLGFIRKHMLDTSVFPIKLTYIYTFLFDLIFNKLINIMVNQFNMESKHYELGLVGHVGVRNESRGETVTQLKKHWIYKVEIM